MCGSATLTIVVSSTCMKVLDITAIVISARLCFAAAAIEDYFEVATVRVVAVVSTVTVALVPTRNGKFGSDAATAIRTGTRCVTFTQLPVAFCGGSSEKAAPLARLMFSTRPSNR